MNLKVEKNIEIDKPFFTIYGDTMMTGTIGKATIRLIDSLRDYNNFYIEITQPESYLDSLIVSIHFHPSTDKMTVFELRIIHSGDRDCSAPGIKRIGSYNLQEYEKKKAINHIELYQDGRYCHDSHRSYMVIDGEVIESLGNNMTFPQGTFLESDPDLAKLFTDPNIPFIFEGLSESLMELELSPNNQNEVELSDELFKKLQCLTAALNRANKALLDRKKIFTVYEPIEEKKQGENNPNAEGYEPVD